MALLMLLAACGWSTPEDPEAPEVLNVIAGDVVVTGAPAVAPTYVLVFDAADPPPPAGTGSPITFSSVPGEAYTGDGAGVQAAPYSTSRIPDGSWILSALLDADGDFQPLLSSNAGATCGDWVGAHVADLATGTIAPVDVSGGILLDDVTVTVGIEMTTERPAFTLETARVSQSVAETQFITLASTGIYSSILELTGPFDGTDPCDTMFLFYAPDANADGQPDPHPNPALAAGGALDVWPRVYLQYLGQELEPGESWAAEAVVYPAPLLSGAVALGVPTPVTSLDAIWIPAAIHTLADGTEETVSAPALPVGAWSVTVVSITGQTWTLPNEVAAFPPADDGFDPSTQGAALLIE